MINVDVAKTTRDLIPELLPPDAIRDDTVSALVNALYLKCAWRYRFTEDATTPRPFHTPGGTKDVPTMELSERIGYAATDGWQVVEPARGRRRRGGRAAAGRRPRDAPSPTWTRTCSPTSSTRRGTSRSSCGCRRSTSRMQAELTPPLNQLGVRTVFSRDADLSGISASELAVQAVLHEAVLKLDEQGLEGAAATAVMMRLLSLPTGKPVEVHVDRPFLLVVRHQETGVVYFLARVVDPAIAPVTSAACCLVQTVNEEETMPRIPGVATKDAGLLIRVGYWFAKRRFGVVPEPFTVLARHRKLFMAAARHEMAAEKASKTLPANVRELAVYRVAQQLGCSWCVDFGTMLQKHEGLDIDRLKHIDDYRTSPTYTRQERLAVAYADAMTATPVQRHRRAGGRAARRVRRRGRARADLPDRPGEHARPDVQRARHPRPGLQLRRRLPAARVRDQREQRA